MQNLRWQSRPRPAARPADLAWLQQSLDAASGAQLQRAGSQRRAAAQPPPPAAAACSSSPRRLCGSPSRQPATMLAALHAERHSACPLRPAAGKGGKNRRRGKNDSDDKRELIFKEDGQGEAFIF